MGAIVLPLLLSDHNFFQTLTQYRYFIAFYGRLFCKLLIIMYMIYCAKEGCSMIRNKFAITVITAICFHGFIYSHEKVDPPYVGEKNIYDLHVLATDNEATLTNIRLNSSLKKEIEAYLSTFYKIVNNKRYSIEEIKKTIRDDYRSVEKRINPSRFSIINRSAKNAWVKFGRELLRLTVSEQQQKLRDNIKRFIAAYKVTITNIRGGRIGKLIRNRAAKLRATLLQFFQDLEAILNDNTLEELDMRKAIRKLLSQSTIQAIRTSFGSKNNGPRNAWVTFYGELNKV